MFLTVSRTARTLAIAGLLWMICLQAVAEAIVVGGEDGYQPYETLTAEGEPVGFNIDLMRAIGAELGTEVTFRLGSWDAMRQALRSGEIDVLAMFVSDQREQWVDFARPHVIVHHRIFIPSGSAPISRIEDLDGRSVIVQRQAWSHEYLERSGLDLDLTLVDTDAEGLALLARGNHDAALLTEHRGRYALRRQQLDNLTVSGPPVLPVEYALAVREGNQALLKRLNTGLERVMASGEFDDIYERWLQPLDSDLAGASRGAILMAVLVAILMTLMLAWLLWKLWRYRRDMRSAHEQIAYLRDHDALTGLLSRHMLEQHLTSLCESSAGGPHSLLDVNIDQFRVLNETLGHAQADGLLKDLGKRLQEILPGQAVIARQSADDFAVLLPETDEDIALALGHKLLTGIRNEPLPAVAEAGSVTLSIGVASFNHHEDNIANILRRADCACVAAKEDGGNQVHVWHPEDRRLAEKFGELAWVARIQQALNDGRMALFWQPIVPVDGPPFPAVSIEILVRMLPENEGDEIVAAGQFMPAAERYFMTTQIDRWVLTTMLEWMAANPDVVARLERVNLNLSGRSLGDQRILAFLERTFQRYSGLLPKLCLEVTETALISNLDRARRVLERLHHGGCRIALDDFGTGVSSMNYLRQLPVDYLKVDGSFVRDIDRDPSAFEFISEINRLGQAMGKITVAECVETESVQRCLQRAGFDLMQGYFIGHPAPLDDLLPHLEQSNSVK